MDSIDVDTALAVWREEGEMPYCAGRVSDYFDDDGRPLGGRTREEAFAMLRADDEAADERNRSLMERAIRAAIGRADGP